MALEADGVAGCEATDAPRAVLGRRRHRTDDGVADRLGVGPSAVGAAGALPGAHQVIAGPARVTNRVAHLNVSKRTTVKATDSEMDQTRTCKLLVLATIEFNVSTEILSAEENQVKQR